MVMVQFSILVVLTLKLNTIYFDPLCFKIIACLLIALHYTDLLIL